jgi:DNA-binding transcriptional LysR family regulator
MTAIFNWDDVRFFLAVVREKKLSVAARMLGCDHTTVGRRIVALEDALGTKLFDRSISGYTLTKRGEAFVPVAEAMERDALIAQSEMLSSDVSLKGAVRIGAPDGFSSYFLAPRLGAFVKQHPEVEVRIIAMPRIFSLSRREVDVAILLARPSEGRLLARKVTDYKLGLFAASDYLATAPKIRKLADLAQHPFIGYTEEHIFAPELDYLNEIGANIKVPIKSSNLIAQLNAAKSGLGICVLPYFMAVSETKLKPILRNDFMLTRSYWLAIHEDQKKLARINRFSDFVCNQAKRCRDFFLELS